jgi:transposase
MNFLKESGPCGTSCLRSRIVLRIRNFENKPHGTRYLDRSVERRILDARFTGYSRWFERLLAELGFEVWMGDPAEIKATRAKKQKFDREDARLLLRLMRENNSALS